MMRSLRFLVAAVCFECRFIYRNPSVLILLCGIPLFYSFTLSGLYMKRQALERPAAVVDRDGSTLAHQVIFDLDATPEVAIRYRLDSLAKGWEKMRRGEVELLVLLPDELTTRVKRGEQGTIRLWVNSANMLTYGQAYTALNQVVAYLNHELSMKYLVNRGVTRGVAGSRSSPILKTERLLYNPSLAYGDFLIEGIFVIMVQALVLITLSFSTAMKREKGEVTLLRERPLLATLGELIAQLGFYLAAVLLLLFIVFPLFGWPLRSALAMFLVFSTFIVSLSPIALLLAPLFRDRAEVFQLLMFVSMPLFLISGFTWPFDQMPRAIRLVAAIFPSTPAIQAVRMASVKSSSVIALFPYFGWMLLIFLGGLGLALSFSRRLNRYLDLKHT